MKITYPISTTSVVVATNDTVRPIEVVPAIRHARILPVVEVTSATSSSNVLWVVTCHVVDYGIWVDSVEINFEISVM